MYSNSSPYAALKIPEFRLFLLARLLVTVAVQIQILAVGWQIYELTKSPLMLGLIGLAEALPNISMALYAGHIADVVNRKLIACFSVFVLFLCIGALSFSSYYFIDKTNLLALIFILISITGFARSFYAPTVFAMVSDMMPRECLGNAAAWLTAVWQASAVLGPVLGGFLYLQFASITTYLVSTILLFLALICFLFISSKSANKEKIKAGALENIKEGLEFVFSNQIILAAMALDLFAVLFGGAVALLPAFSAEIFHMGPQALGIMRASPAFGAFIIATILTHKPITSNAGKILLLAVAGFGLSIIAFGISTNYYLSLLLLTLSGALDGISVYIRSTIFQLLTPDEMKGRFASVNSIFIGSSNEIGEFESGLAAKYLGLVPSVVFGGFMTIFIVMITLFRAPKLRSLHIQDLYHKISTKISN